MDSISYDSDDSYDSDEYKDWDFKSAEGNLTIEFIRENVVDINWTILCQNQALNNDAIREFADYIDWRFIGLDNDLGSSVIMAYDYGTGEGLNIYTFDEIKNFKGVSGLDEIFVREHIDYIDWNLVSFWISEGNFSDGFIDDNINRINWSIITYMGSPFCTILRNYPEYIDWEYMWRYAGDAEEEDEDFQKYYFEGIDQYIHEYSDRINWDNLSELKHEAEFLFEFGDKLNWERFHWNSSGHSYDYSIASEINKLDDMIDAKARQLDSQHAVQMMRIEKTSCSTLEYCMDVARRIKVCKGINQYNYVAMKMTREELNRDIIQSALSPDRIQRLLDIGYSIEDIFDE